MRAGERARKESSEAQIGQRLAGAGRRRKALHQILKEQLFCSEFRCKNRLAEVITRLFLEDFGACLCCWHWFCSCGFDFSLGVCHIAHEVHDIVELFHLVLFEEGNGRSLFPDNVRAILCARVDEECRTGLGCVGYRCRGVEWRGCRLLILLLVTSGCGLNCRVATGGDRR